MGVFSSGSRFPARMKTGRHRYPRLPLPDRGKVMQSIDHLEAERFSPLGDEPAVLIDLADPGAADAARAYRSRTAAIVIGVDRLGVGPLVDEACFDVLLSTDIGAARPWVGISADRIDARISELRAMIGKAPIASATACMTFRIGATLPFSDALKVESLAYSTLLAGAEFARWHAAQPSNAAPSPVELVRIARAGDRWDITLAEPGRRNAMCARMRDALFEALAMALDDPTCPSVRLRGEGACFSTGGDLAEFGTARDLAEAHTIRSLRSCAALLHELGDRAEARVHGACIGSGIEIPAAAARLVVVGDAYFQLPEIRMGLIPGAGGTVTIARRIGHHRACYLALSAMRLRAPTALAWGLVDCIETP